MQNPINSSKIITCQYLGLRDDPGSYLGNPSPGNYCYHCKVVTSPLITHQETHCLSEAHLECSVYAQDEKKPFPRALQGESVKPDFQGSNTTRNIWILLGVILLVVFGWLSFQYFKTGKIMLPGMVLVSPSVVASAPATKIQPTAVLPTQTPMLPTSTPKPSATPSPTPTVVPAQRHALEVPVIVDSQEYLIHLAMDGEGFDFLAKNYKTSVEVIRAINYLLPPAIWVNLPIIVSPGVTTVDPALPALQAYKVIDQSIDIDDLARKLKVDVTLLKHFNACPVGCTLAKGDWIIVPYTK